MGNEGGPRARPLTLAGLFHIDAAGPRLTRWERRALLVARRLDHGETAKAAHPHHHARTPQAVLYLGLLFVLWVLNAADLALTLHWTDAAGWTAEGNRIMRSVARLAGDWGFVLYKLLLMTVVVLVLWWLYLQVEDGVSRARRALARTVARVGFVGAWTFTAGLVVFYTWVVWNNLRVSGLA